MTLQGNLFVPLGGWGRNINHDPRSRLFEAARFTEGGAGALTDWGHDIHIAPMDQGNLGRCVPTAGTAMLATDPFWDTLSAELRAVLADPVAVENFAIQAYREVTRLDPYPGAWEPDDTGSDGLSLWKLFRQRGYVVGAEHVTSIDDAHVAGRKKPYPIGISWLEGMDQPRPDGTVQVTGKTRGGHEVLMYRYDAARDLWWCRNSWGRNFGKGGDFAFDTPGYMKLMSLQADGTPMDLTTVTPSPVPPSPPADDFPYGPMDMWANRVTRLRGYVPSYERNAAQVYSGWRKTHGAAGHGA